MIAGFARWPGREDCDAQRVRPCRGQGEKSGRWRQGQDEKIGARLPLAAEGGRYVAHRFPALIAAPAAAQERIWLTGARLFDGTGSPLRENAAILIEDGIIRRVADAAEPCPDGAWLLDVGQRVLMPGLTDAHTYASGTVPQVAKGAEEPLPGITAHFLQAELRDYLRFGVTTIRVVGTLPVPARKAGRLILVSPGTAVGPSGQDAVGLYARVSSHDVPVARLEAEVGSGMNELRAKGRRLLADPEVTVVVMEHRDQLGRMNIGLAGADLAAHGRRLVVDDGEVTDDLGRDMVEVLTWFSRPIT